jgi:hypothetical protein
VHSPVSYFGSPTNSAQTSDGDSLFWQLGSWDLQLLDCFQLLDEVADTDCLELPDGFSANGGHSQRPGAASAQVPEGTAQSRTNTADDGDIQFWQLLNSLITPDQPCPDLPDPGPVSPWRDGSTSPTLAASSIRDQLGMPKSERGLDHTRRPLFEPLMTCAQPTGDDPLCNEHPETCSGVLHQDTRTVTHGTPEETPVRSEAAERAGGVVLSVQHAGKPIQSSKLQPAALSIGRPAFRSAGQQQADGTESLETSQRQSDPGRFTGQKSSRADERRFCQGFAGEGAGEPSPGMNKGRRRSGESTATTAPGGGQRGRQQSDAPPWKQSSNARPGPFHGAEDGRQQYDNAGATPADTPLAQPKAEGGGQEGMQKSSTTWPIPSNAAATQPRSEGAQEVDAERQTNNIQPNHLKIEIAASTGAGLLRPAYLGGPKGRQQPCGAACKTPLPRRAASPVSSSGQPTAVRGAGPGLTQAGQWAACMAPTGLPFCGTLRCSIILEIYHVYLSNFFSCSACADDGP